MAPGVFENDRQTNYIVELNFEFKIWLLAHSIPPRRRSLREAKRATALSKFWKKAYQKAGSPFIRKHLEKRVRIFFNAEKFAKILNENCLSRFSFSLRFCSSVSLRKWEDEISLCAKLKRSALFEICLIYSKLA